MFIGNPLRRTQDALSDNIGRMQTCEPGGRCVSPKSFAKFTSEFLGAVCAECEAGESRAIGEVLPRYCRTEPAVLRFGNERNHHPAVGRAVTTGRNVKQTWDPTLKGILRELVTEERRCRLCKIDVDVPTFAYRRTRKQSG